MIHNKSLQELQNRIQRIIEADTDNFLDLARILNLDPTKDFRGTDLSGVDLNELDLIGADFSYTMLRGASMRGTNLKKSNLSGADLRGAHLQNSILIETVFCDANLKGADLSGARVCDPITLNPEYLDLQLKRDSEGIALPIWEQPIHEMKIEGFLPVILNITPVTQPLLSGEKATTISENNPLKGKKWKGAIYDKNVKLSDSGCLQLVYP